MKTSKVISSLGILLIATACSGGSKPNVEIIQDMMESPAIKAQEYDEASPNHSGMRVPPENTAPVGFQPYKYATNLDLAEKELKNPLPGDFSEETLIVGQKYYTTQCAVCHGAQGEGGALLPTAQKMALKPPAVTSDKIVGWTDAHIYHVITAGQGVMGPYASHVPQKYRWQVVNYVRFLQKQNKK
jgi:mono/diheme cytochrome c family protein